jgi:hypothetical protein
MSLDGVIAGTGSEEGPPFYAASAGSGQPRQEELAALVEDASGAKGSA